jgi:hypothetical protein
MQHALFKLQSPKLTSTITRNKPTIISTFESFTRGFIRHRSGSPPSKHLTRPLYSASISLCSRSRTVVSHESFPLVFGQTTSVHFKLSYLSRGIFIPFKDTIDSSIYSLDILHLGTPIPSPVLASKTSTQQQK